MREETLQWHPAFQAVLQIELMEDKDFLHFEKEYNLSEKPLAIDTLVIKLQPGYQIHKSIGRIFRQYNVIEYKSPSDYVSVNVYYKVLGYACILQSNTEHVQQIPPQEITLTFVTNHYPRHLIEHLQENHSAVLTQPESGIYYLSGLTFPVQILLVPKLTKDEYIWLSRLRSNLDTEDAACLSEHYVGKNNSPLYSAAMNIMVRANKSIYEEVKPMCEAIRELFADEWQENTRKYEQQLQQRYQQFQQQLQQQQQQLQQRLQQSIQLCQELSLSREETFSKLVNTFQLTPEAAQEYLDLFWTPAP